MKPLAAVWTAADEAEWRLLVHELLVQAWPHRDRPGFSAALGEALEALLDWRRRRELLTIAVRLRATQDLANARAVA